MNEPNHLPITKTLTHVGPDGAATMVDVGQKPITQRTASAEAYCRMKLATAEAIRANSLAKGDVLNVARLAAIQAAKRTDELIPLCHSLPLDGVAVQFEWTQPDYLRILVTATVTARTGVEMEAMVGASIAALTVYDMCKAIDRTMTVQSIALVAKTGGSSGTFNRTLANGESHD